MRALLGKDNDAVIQTLCTKEGDRLDTENADHKRSPNLNP